MEKIIAKIKVNTEFIIVPKCLPTQLKNMKPISIHVKNVRLQKKLKTLDPSDPEVARTLNALMELKKRKDNMQEVEDGR